MSQEEPDTGPKIVWTFPLLRRLDSGPDLLNIGGNVQSLMSNQGAMSSDNRTNTKSDSPSISPSIEGGLDQIRNQIESVTEQSESIFNPDPSPTGDDGTKVKQVSIQDEVFIPTVVEIPVGGTVKWVNRGDSAYNVMSTRGEDFTSGELQPGETYTRTFDEEQSIVYIDRIRGGDVMSGAVVVGDADRPSGLPSDIDSETPVPFEKESKSRSMKEAAGDKDKSFE